MALRVSNRLLLVRPRALLSAVWGSDSTSGRGEGEVKDARRPLHHTDLLHVTGMGGGGDLCPPG